MAEVPKISSGQDPGDNRLNGEGSDKQVLAPAEGPRESLHCLKFGDNQPEIESLLLARQSHGETLITTAVKFLQNPKVMSSPLYQKKAFLEKKGLTQEEIRLAVERAGITESGSAEIAQPGPPPGYQPGVIGAGPPLPVQPYVPIPPQSMWARARDLTVTTFVVASVSYAVYQLFQVYLRPLILGKSAQERRMERLETQVLEMQKSVTESLAEMSKSLVAIQISINNQQIQLAKPYEMKGHADLKADIASLKGLLLSRNQFPPAPTTSPVLPLWQRAQPAVTSNVSDSNLVESDSNTNETQVSEAESPTPELNTVPCSEQKIESSESPEGMTTEKNSEPVHGEGSAEVNSG